MNGTNGCPSQHASGHNEIIIPQGDNQVGQECMPTNMLMYAKDGPRVMGKER